jgi:hypothetical protein
LPAPPRTKSLKSGRNRRSAANGRSVPIADSCAASKLGSKDWSRRGPHHHTHDLTAFARTSLSLRSSGVNFASARLRARSYRMLSRSAPANAASTSSPISAYQAYSRNIYVASDCRLPRMYPIGVTAERTTPKERQRFRKSSPRSGSGLPLQQRSDLSSLYPNDLPDSAEAGHSRIGRVEDGRGSLGPMANAPLPIPPQHGAKVPDSDITATWHTPFAPTGGNGSNIRALAATLLFAPALPPAAPLASWACASWACASWACASWACLARVLSRLAATLPVSILRIASIASALVILVRWHRPAPVCALRLQPFHSRGDVAAESTMVVLGNCQTCKTTHATKYRNRAEHLDHAPTSIAERLCCPKPPQTCQICGIGLSHDA